MNKRKTLLTLLYTASLAAILWYPAGKIKKFEFPSVAPVEVKFKATVYDPYDPMRGRYVRLRVQPDEIKTADKKSRFKYLESGYAVIKKDPKGFARILRLEKDKAQIQTGELAVKVRSVWYFNRYKKRSAGYGFSWPFERFYLNELKAPELEAELQNRRNPVVLKVNIFPDGSFAVSGMEK